MGLWDGCRLGDSLDIKDMGSNDALIVNEGFERGEGGEERSFGGAVGGDGGGYVRAVNR